ncbi:MAG: nascent polypeptide-associated complex protein [Thermoplasmata archaeon]|nr:nascent polypeptide-associated complex protein [Thermoplasmata archaeon]
MFPGGRVNPRQMKAMMKRMGISQEDIEDVEEIVIKTKSKELIFHEAIVSVMTVQGQKTYQIVGEPEIRERAVEPAKKESPDEDVVLVMEQTGVSREEAAKVLEECGGQPAEAILKIMSSRG